MSEIHPMSETVKLQQNEFATLYSSVHLSLLRYVMSLIPDRAQAEDVVQETAGKLWEKFDQYDPTMPFWPWAKKFAYFEVLKHRKKAAVRSKYFASELIEELAEDRTAHAEELDDRRIALQSCLEKLDKNSREMLIDRYAKERTIAETAASHGRSANALYVVMHRIRRRLTQCVYRKLNAAKFA